MDGETFLVWFLAGEDFECLVEVEPALVSHARILVGPLRTYLTRLAGGGLSAILTTLIQSYRVL